MSMSVLNRKSGYFNKVRRSLIKLADTVDPENKIEPQGSFYEDVADSLERISNNFDGNDGGEPFVISLTYDTGKYTADKTDEEIIQAYNDGKALIIKVSILWMGSLVPLQFTMATVGIINDVLAYASTSNVDPFFDGFFLRFQYMNQQIGGNGWELKSFFRVLPSASAETGANTEYPIRIATNDAADDYRLYTHAYSSTGSNTDGTMTQKAITEALRYDIDMHTDYINEYALIYDAFHSFETAAYSALSGQSSGATQSFYRLTLSQDTDLNALISEIKSGYDHCGSVRLIMDYDGRVIELSIVQFCYQLGTVVIHRVSEYEGILCSADIELVKGDHQSTAKVIGTAAKM